MITVIAILALVALVMLLSATKQKNAAIHRVELRLDAAAQAAGIPTGLEPSAEVVALALDPSKNIEALRAYRQQTGVDLATAQAAIAKIRARA